MDIAMRCAVCGRPGVTAGDGHLCRLDGDDDTRSKLGRPPTTGWRLMSSVVLGIVLAYIVACIVKIGLLLRDHHLVNLVTRSSNDVTASQLTSLATAERVVTDLQQLLVLGYIVSFIVWFVMIRRVLLRNGFDPNGVLMHWTVIAWGVSIALSVVLAFVTSPTPVIDLNNFATSRIALLGFDRDQILFTGVRIVVAALCVGAVLVLRRRVRQQVFGALEAVVASH